MTADFAPKNLAPLDFFSGAPVAHSGAKNLRRCWIFPIGKLQRRRAPRRLCAVAHQRRKLQFTRTGKSRARRTSDQ